ncbi:unnamed protein product [Mesocestoides corti]|uniref:EGF-like domain-containing protein n=1 Tax=Mesocestoides corti TaxID=53468 RepID=A0A0R3UDV3_MESCO|nr:unnamed protein product [Mesocestoides corti]
MHPLVVFAAFILQVAGAFSPYVCPQELADGVPFELYGGPLYPVAAIHAYYGQVETPFWTNVSGSWTHELLSAVTNTDVGRCLVENLTSCSSKMRETFGNSLGKLFPYFYRPLISNHLMNEVDQEKWSKEPLDDFSNKDLVLIRRTLLIQCMYWCHLMLGLPPTRRPRMLEMCPNPCNQAEICSGTGEVPGTCQLNGEGFFKHQYRCDCKPGFIWSSTLRCCLPDNPCERKNEPVCFPDGTLSCSYDSELNEISCFCKPEYMGNNCSISANACEELIRNPLLPNGGQLAVGNRACNINNDGNLCVPSLDPDLGPTYTCVCASGRWTGDINLRYDNCLKKVTKCDQIICIKGECVDSRDGTEAVCVCKEGYDSPMCATWTGVWSLWSPWGRCTPSCGLERWAIRTRRCLVAEKFPNSEHLDCNGSSIEFFPCEPHACASMSVPVLLHSTLPV